MAADQALVLAAHGSHHDPRAAAPVHAHADRLRERGEFRAVRAAFWKEQPSLAEVCSTVEAATTYVVPLTTSEGYFTDRVFPRELGLEDGRRADAGMAVRYAAPVGTHERIRDVVLDRVRGAVDDGVDESDLGLALVGHGTPRHERSATATVVQVERLRALGRFAGVEALFLDQSPNVETLQTAFDVDDVVVVPFFIGDSVHVRRDIPEAIGLAADGAPFGGSTRVGGARIWYTRAVGSSPALTAIILERAADAGAEVGHGAGDRIPRSGAERAFCRWLEGGPERAIGGIDPAVPTRHWGELVIAVTAAGSGRRRYSVRHADDLDLPPAALDRLGAAAVRERTGIDEVGHHRPLRTARGLPRGWVAAGLDARAMVRTVRAVYPASIDHWHRARTGRFAVADWAAVVERQTGRYRDLEAVDPNTVHAAVEACCGACVRRRAWTVDGDEPAANRDGFPCPEPCSILLEATRTLDTTALSDEPADPSVPAAAFDRPGNPYHVRFRRAREAAATETLLHQ